MRGNIKAWVACPRCNRRVPPGGHVRKADCKPIGLKAKRAAIKRLEDSWCEGEREQKAARAEVYRVFGLGKSRARRS